MVSQAVTSLGTNESPREDYVRNCCRYSSSLFGRLSGENEPCGGAGVCSIPATSVVDQQANREILCQSGKWGLLTDTTSSSSRPRPPSILS